MDAPAADRPALAPLGVACFGAFVAALSTSLVAVSAPVLAKDLHVTPADVSWVLSSYLLTVSALLATAGRLADLLGHRRVYVTGFAIYALGALGCALAGTLGVLVAARVVQGVGSAMLMATGPAIVARAFPDGRRARGLGMQLAFTYVGLTLGPTLGGVLVSSLGWHAVFATNTVAGVVGAALSSWALRERESTPRGRVTLDPLGSVLLACGLTALLLALRKDAALPLPTLGLALVLLTAFAIHEARHPAPLLPVTLFRSGAFTSGVTGATLLYVVLFVLSYLLPFDLQLTHGMTPAHAGLLMTAQPAVMAVTAPFSGVLADRFGARLPSVCGMVLIATALFLVGSATSGDDLPVASALGLLGLGAGLYVAPNNAEIMAAAPKERQGTAAAMAATARNVGMAGGIALAVRTDGRLGFRGSMWLAAALAVGGAVLATTRRPSRDASRG